MPDEPLMTPDERRLRKLTIERRELEQRIANQVARCRRGGSTWTAVGRSLGVSQQAAHERYAERGGATAPTSPR